MSLLDALTTVPQREKGGSTALERFDFQTCWGISHLLTLHEAGHNYAVGFEFHDDIVVIDNATSPTKARFFQLKTASSGKWTLKKITNRKVAKGASNHEPSIAAKMFDSRTKFGSATDYLGFVSNQPCDFIDENKLPCSFYEADKKNFDHFVEAMKKEIAPFTEEDGKLFNYHLSELNLNNYEDTLLGKFVNFIESQCGLLECNHKGFYLSVIDQCRKKSKHLKDIDNFNELLSAKFVTRVDMASWLKELQTRTCGRPDWSAVVPDLKSLTMLQKRALKRDWDRYEFDVLTRANIATGRFRDAIRNLLDGMVDDAAGLEELLDKALPSLMKISHSLSYPATENYLRAAFLYELYAS